MNKNMPIGYMICETASSEIQDTKIITTQNNRLVAEGTLQDADVINRNQRYYDRKDLFPELKCARTEELLKTGNMKGENGHPSSKDIARQQTIDPNNVCVKFLKFWTEDNLVKGQFKGTNNQLGEDFNNDLLDGEKPSFSLRALGTIENVGGKAYVRNLKLITYDRVIFPSHKVAYTDKLVTESGMMMEERPSGLIAPITNDKIINYIKTESCNIKHIMNNFDVLYESIELINRGKDIQLVDKLGNVMIVNLENYIQDEIFNYCSDKFLF